MSRHDDRLHPVDAAVLGHLQETGVDYPTCIAYRREIPPADVNRRCDALAARGLVEPVSHEVVYRLTDAGARALAAHHEQEAVERSVAQRHGASADEAGEATTDRPSDRANTRPPVERGAEESRAGPPSRR